MLQNNIEIGHLHPKGKIEEWSDKEWDCIFRPVDENLGIKMVQTYKSLWLSKNVTSNKLILFLNGIIIQNKIQKVKCNKHFFPKLDNTLREILNNNEFFKQSNNNGFLISPDYLKQGDILISENEAYIVLSNGIKSNSFIIPNTIVITTPNYLKKSYNVKVNIPLIKIYSQPNKNSTVVTFAKKNKVLAISAEKGKWGKISGAKGWINLEFTQKV